MPLDPVSQTLAQQQSGSAGGEGFASFYVQGRQLAQQQQQLNLSGQRLRLEQQQERRMQTQQNMLLQYEQRLVKEQAALVGVQAEERLAALERQNESNAFLPELHSLERMMFQRGVRDPEFLARYDELNSRNPKAFVVGVGQEIRQSIAAEAIHHNERVRIAEMRREFPDLQGVQFPKGGGAQFSRLGAQPGTMSPVGKMQADLREAIANGDIEAASQLRAAITAAATKSGMAIRTNPDGTVEITQGGATAAVPASTISRAEEAANSAENIVAFGKELLELASPATTGLQGNVTRLSKSVLGQFMPSVEAGKEFDYAQAASAFRAAATRLLKSDSQITEDERRAIIENLPNASLLEATSDAKRKTRNSMRLFGESARRQLLRAGRTLPTSLMTPAEVRTLFQAGKMSREEAEAAIVGSLFPITEEAP